MEEQLKQILDKLELMSVMQLHLRLSQERLEKVVRESLAESKSNWVGFNGWAKELSAK